MRVLIILALVGAAVSEYVSSVVVDEAKPRYEYSSSVQTPQYNNFAYVRSGGDVERTVYSAPLVAAVRPEPTIIAARSDLPYYATPYYTSNYVGSPFIRTAIPASNYVFKSDFPTVLPTTRLQPVALGERYLVKAAEPAIIPAAIATPAKFVSTFVEPKIVGEGILERKSQYHSQNELGEATYGHREPFQSHDAVQDAFGNKVGSFSYVGADGRLLKTDYVADALGYRVKSNAEGEKLVVRRRRSAPTEETVEKKEETVDPKAPVEKRSLSYIAPSILAPTVLRSSWPLPLSRSWVAPTPYAYSPYAYSPYYASPYYRTSYLW